MTSSNATLSVSLIEEMRARLPAFAEAACEMDSSKAAWRERINQLCDLALSARSASESRMREAERLLTWWINEYGEQEGVSLCEPVEVATQEFLAGVTSSATASPMPEQLKMHPGVVKIVDKLSSMSNVRDWPAEDCRVLLGFAVLHAAYTTINAADRGSEK